MNAPVRVAFLTSAELEALTADDRLAAAILEARGISVEAAVWTDARVDYTRFDLVVIRSTWDWHEHSARFSAHLAELERRGVRVENAGAHEWLDKRYLARLAKRGVRTFETHVIASRADLADEVAEYKYARWVLKPATAAGGRDTVRFASNDAASAHATLDAIIASGDVALLQPYVEEVVTDGEWSLLFYDGVYSHSVKKRAAAGDFRVHAEFGGETVREDAPASIIADANAALAASERTFLYTRIDGVVVPKLGGFCVTELEVVEPELFLRFDAEAPRRFADAIAARLR